ncbi:MAG: hypothetical protein QM667_00500 [Asticcacaulis sp.]
MDFISKIPGFLASIGGVLAADYIAAYAQALAVIVAIFTIRASTLSAKQSKIADVVMHCSLRYEDLAVTYSELIRQGFDTPASKLALDHYYRRFWGLKNDQFDYWITGMLDHDTFYDWSYNLATKFLDDLERGPVANGPKLLTQSWEEWQINRNQSHSGASNPAFEQFTVRLRQMAENCHRQHQPDALALAVLDTIQDFDRDFAARWRKRITRSRISFSAFHKAISQQMRNRAKIRKAPRATVQPPR